MEAIAEVHGSPTLQRVTVIGGAVGCFGAVQDEPWLFYSGLAFLVIGVAEVLWQRRNSLVVLYPSFMVIRLRWLSRT